MDKTSWPAPPDVDAPYHAVPAHHAVGVPVDEVSVFLHKFRQVLDSGAGRRANGQPAGGRGAGGLMILVRVTTESPLVAARIADAGDTIAAHLQPGDLLARIGPEGLVVVLAGATAPARMRRMIEGLTTVPAPDGVTRIRTGSAAYGPASTVSAVLAAALLALTAETDTTGFGLPAPASPRFTNA